MRFFKHSAISWFFGTGLSVAGAVSGVACSDDAFDGCEASKTCGGKASAGSGNAAGQGGAGGRDSSAKGGKSGSGAAGAGGGSTVGESGTAGGPAQDAGGTAGTSNSDSSKAGADDGEDHEPDDMGTAGVGDGGTGGEPWSEPAIDDVPPGIVDVSPANGATGVDDDAEIVITFDEPMDNASTESAFRSEELPPDSVELYWRDGSRQLIVRPKEKLSYADVTSPTGVAKAYAFTLAGTATDVAGNQLGSDSTHTFTTYRHVTHSLQVPMNGGRQSIANDAPLTGCSTPIDELLAGDDFNDESYAFLLSFDISPLPAGIVKWGNVSLRMLLNLHPSDHLPYGEERLGDLHYFSTSGDPDAFAWSNLAENDVGVYASNSGAKDVSHGVRPWVAADYAERETRGNLSQYALRFDKRTDGDARTSQVGVYCGAVELNLEYWVP